MKDNTSVGYVYISKVDLGNLCNNVLTYIMEQREEFENNFFTAYMEEVNFLIMERNKKWYVNMFKLKPIKILETIEEARKFRKSRKQYFVNDFASDLLVLGTKLLQCCKGEEVKGDMLISVDSYYKLKYFYDNPRKPSSRDILTNINTGTHTIWVS